MFFFFTIQNAFNLINITCPFEKRSPIFKKALQFSTMASIQRTCHQADHYGFVPQV